MDVWQQIFSFPKVSVMSLISASIYAFSGFVPLPDYASAMWYLSRLLGVYAVITACMLALRVPVRRHPLALRDRQAQMTSTCVAQLLDLGKLSAVALAVQGAMPHSELPRLFTLLVIYLLVAPLATYGLALLCGLTGRGRKIVTSFCDVTPMEDVTLVAAVLNPSGRTFTGVPPEERLYREFRPPRSVERTSAVKRTTSTTKGSEGEGRCTVLDEGPHFNRTARGCLLSVS